MTGAMDSATDLTEHDLASPARRSRFNATLVGETLNQVEEIAEAEGADLGEVVRRAIKLAHFIYREQARGALLKLHAPGGRVDRITVHYRPRARDASS
ncbi:hypothetical protein ACWEVP_37275 [Amycolatopsis sp. NPDC003865]